MFCNKCGKELENSIKFCPNCGQAVLVPNNDISTDITDNKLQKNKYVKWLVFAVIIQCVLFLTLLIANNDASVLIYLFSFIPTLIISIMCIVKSKQCDKYKGRIVGTVFAVLNSIVIILVVASLISVSINSDSQTTTSNVSADYNNAEDISLARNAAIEYCNMIENKNKNIVSVELTDNISNFGETMYYFECKVESNNYKTRYGTITVCKINSERFDVLSMKYNDEK